MTDLERRHRAHIGVVADLENLTAAARQAGFDLKLCSSFRSYERQKKIWNEKALGLRPVMDEQGNTLDVLSLSEKERLFKILRWSALPGASRHHWGTDFDVYDAAAVPIDYIPQLSFAEYTGQGPFAPLADWLKKNAARFGFFSPYSEDRGGVHPEPWHISHIAIASDFLRQYSPEVLKSHLWQCSFELVDIARENFKVIHRDFIKAAAPS